MGTSAQGYLGVCKRRKKKPVKVLKTCKISLVCKNGVHWIVDEKSLKMLVLVSHTLLPKAFLRVSF